MLLPLFPSKKAIGNQATKMGQGLLLKRHFLLSYSHTGLVDDGLTGSGVLSRWIDKAVREIKAKWNITSQKGASSRGTAERTLSIDPFMYSLKSFKTSVTVPGSLDAEKHPAIGPTSRKQHFGKGGGKWVTWAVCGLEYFLCEISKQQNLLGL